MAKSMVDQKQWNHRQRQHVTGDRVPIGALNPQTPPLSEEAIRQCFYPGPERKSHEEENSLEL